MLSTVANNSGKRLTVALTLIICAGAAGVVANRGVASVAAPHHVSAPSASQASPATVGSLAAHAIATRMSEAIKTVEPHGGIGEPAFAVRP
jgi:hypothetical protein